VNILSVIHYPVFGGPHNRNSRVAPRCEALGWPTTVLLPDEPGDAVQRLRDAGVDVITRPLHRLRATPDPRVQMRHLPRLWSDVKTVRALIRERDIDVVLINGLVNPQAAFAARAEGAAVVWQLLDTRAPAALRRASMQLVIWLADVIMSTGVETARIHEGAMAFGDRLVPFFPPVDTAKFVADRTERAAVRAEWGVGARDPVLGAVSNINPQKGIENLIDAFALVRLDMPGARLVLVGAEYDTQRGYSAGLRRQLVRHGLTEGVDVIFTGARPDVARHLHGFDVFVMGSVPNSEGVPTSILEAMSSGLPVVSTDVGGVREVVDVGITGFVVPPRDPEALAKSALRILREPKLRHRMAAEARLQAVPRFDVEVCAQTHIRAFEAAIAHHNSRRRTSMPTRAA
jgi:glycosyltransferase involved in cell wall biosynthesis